MSSEERKLVCVKKVKQDVPEEWEESMPLPGDIIEGIAKDSADNLFLPAVRARSELNSELVKLSRESSSDIIWLKVRRGDRRLKLRACIVQDGFAKLQRKFTVRAASDERHVAVLADLSFQKCVELQEISRNVVNVNSRGFNQQGIKYDWKEKMGTYLPDERSTIISSILFMPMGTERNSVVEAITVRTMAWFSAAVSSGAPLVFVNIQTEQIFSSRKSSKEMTLSSRQQIVQGIRLWYLPGIEELLLRLTPEEEETRFGMEISRTDEGFVCVYSVMKGTAAERSGLGKLLEQANKTGHLVVISRLEGKSLMPSTVTSDGQINCCDNFEIKETLTSAMERMDSIRLHIMSWPNYNHKTVQPSPQGIDASTLIKPPV